MSSLLGFLQRDFDQIESCFLPHTIFLNIISLNSNFKIDLLKLIFIMRPRVKSCGTLKLMEFNGILEFPVFPDFFVVHSYYVWYVVWH